jgi:membrane associated rhomboid family serine protease
VSFADEARGWLNPRSAGGQLALATVVMTVIAGGSPTAVAYLVLVPGEVFAHLKLWLPVTSLFITSPSAWSVIITVLVFLSMGTWLEQQWGTRRFWSFLVGVTLAAELLTTALALLLPSLRPVPVLGASVAFSVLWISQGLIIGPRAAKFFMFPASGYALAALGVAFPLLNAVFGDWRSEVPVFIGIALTVGWLRGWGPENLWLRFRSWQLTRELSRRPTNLRAVPKDSVRKDDSNRYLN